MTALDPRALIVVSGLMSLICTVIILSMRRSFPPSIRGLGQWGAGCVLKLASTPFFAARGLVPDLFSITVAQGLMFAGLLLCLSGLMAFLQRPVPRKAMALAWLGVVAFSLIFSILMPDYGIRQIGLGLALTPIFGAGAVLLWRYGESSFPYQLTAYAFAFGCVLVFLRALLVMLGHGDLFGTSLLQPTPMQNFYLLGFATASLVFTLGFVLMAQDRLVQLLRHEAAHDLLSGALSRHAILDMLNREVVRAQRHNRVLTLMLLDLDHFKQINDRYGHLMGDRVIADFADVVRAQLRDQDCFGRYGGEEFIVLLPETDLAGAAMVAERIRVAVGRGDVLPRYSVSIGVCAMRPGQDALSLLAATDAALYRAKALGRDRVELSTLVPESAP